MAQQIYQAEKNSIHCIVNIYRKFFLKNKILENNRPDNRLWKYGTEYDLKYFFIFFKIIFNINILKSYKNI